MLENFRRMMLQKDEFVGLEREILQKANPGILPGLSRMKELLNRLDNPEQGMATIHIAGTNGKGSTGAFLERIFREGGYATGFYTSPHLVALGERFLWRGETVAFSSWLREWAKVNRALQGVTEKPTYFEIVTALAFLLAQSLKVELLVLEAGMGGRYDATNVNSNVKASVITTISEDHQEYLGNTLEAIGDEKFAIMRSGTFASFRGGQGNFEARFLARAQEVGAEAHLFSRRCVLDKITPTNEGSSFSFSEDGLVIPELAVSMAGRHQVDNGAHALSVAWHLGKHCFPKIEKKECVEGLRKACWPFRGTFFPGNPPCFVDGVHNPEGASAFAAMVEERWASWQHKVLVFSCMEDKDFGAMLGALKGCAHGIICTSIPGSERAASAECLAKEAFSQGWSYIQRSPSPQQALEEAKKEASLVLVCGSLYMLGNLVSSGDLVCF